MIVRFLPQAECELDDAIAFYENQMTGLGMNFFSQIQKTIQLLSRTPLGWRLITEHTQ